MRRAAATALQINVGFKCNLTCRHCHVEAGPSRREMMEAMQARWGQPAEKLEAGHAAWRLEAYYLAQACFPVACIMSPQRIVLGGGVMAQEALFPMIREELARQVNGYLPLVEIVPPELALPALTGALELARAAGR